MGGLAGFGSWGLAQWDAWEGCGVDVGVDVAGMGGHGGVFKGHGCMDWGGVAF